MYKIGYLVISYRLDIIILRHVSVYIDVMEYFITYGLISFKFPFE